MNCWRYSYTLQSRPKTFRTLSLSLLSLYFSLALNLFSVVKPTLGTRRLLLF